MKIIINSKQNYGSYVEEIVEKNDGNVSFEESYTKIEFDSDYILVEKNRIVQKRGENKMVIEAGNTTECNYLTPQGEILLKIEGISIEKGNDKSYIASAKYNVRIDNVEPYLVEIVITGEE